MAKSLRFRSLSKRKIWRTLIEDHTKLNLLFSTRSIQAGVAQSVSRAGVAAKKTIPGLVSTETTQSARSCKTAVNSFWEENPDLDQAREYIPHVYNKIDAENPEIEHHR